MSSGKPMPLAKARELADKLLIALSPHSDRLELAGAIRREVLTVGDIDIVLIPKFERPSMGLFSDVVDPKATPYNAALKKLNDMLDEGIIEKRITHGKPYWGPLSQRAVFQGVDVDINMILDPACWGALMALRTGPADLSKAMVTLKREGGLLPDHHFVHDRRVWRDGVRLDTPEESDFFRILGFAETPHPADRNVLLPERVA